MRRLVQGIYPEKVGGDHGGYFQEIKQLAHGEDVDLRQAQAEAGSASLHGGGRRQANHLRPDGAPGIRGPAAGICPGQADLGEVHGFLNP